MMTPKQKNNSLNRSDKNNSSNTDLVTSLNKTQKNRESLPKYLQTLLNGTEVGILEDMPYPFEKPEWLDMEKMRRGQQFAMNNLFGIMAANGLSIMLASVYRSILGPLIFTGNSDTPFTSFKRYLATISYVRSWYAEDFWTGNNEGHKNIKSVRGMHDRIRKRLMKTPQDQIDKKSTLEGGKPMWTDLHEDILDDFQSCPMLKTPTAGLKQTHVNQTDMVIVQFSFMGLILLYPSMFGIHKASKEELDSFVHLWRALGHVLGIEDRFNLCNGNLITVQQRCHDLINHWLKPLLRHCSRDWIHMSRCMVTGIGYYAGNASFEINLLYLCRVLEIPGTKLKAALSYNQRLRFFITTFLFNYVMMLPGAMSLFNWILSRSLSEVNNKSAAELKTFERTVFPYQMKSTEGKCPM